MFEATSPGSIIMTTGDNTVFPLLYLQMAEGIRQDTAVIHMPMIAVDWYRDMVARAYPNIVIDDRTTNCRDFVKRNIDKRSIFVTIPFPIPSYDPDFQLIPTGVVQQIVEKGHVPEKINYAVPRHLRGVFDTTIKRDLREQTILNVYPMAQKDIGNLYLSRKMPDKSVGSVSSGAALSPYG